MYIPTTAVSDMNEDALSDTNEAVTDVNSISEDNQLCRSYNLFPVVNIPGHFLHCLVPHYLLQFSIDIFFLSKFIYFQYYSTNT